MKTQIHSIRLPSRTGTVTVTEHPDRVVFKLRFSRYGDLDDLDQLRAWLWPILVRYESDPRPNVFDNPLTGECATVWGDGNGCVAVIDPAPGDTN